MTKTYESLCYEDVQEGDRIKELTLPINVTRLVIGAGGERDFAAIHHDIDKAKAWGNRTAFANTTFIQAVLNRVVDDWMGPEGTLKKLRINMRSPIYIEKTLTAKGTVTRKYGEAGQNLLDLDISLDTEDGPCTAATATVSLPSRGSK